MNPPYIAFIISSIQNNRDLVMASTMAHALRKLHAEIGFFISAEAVQQLPLQQHLVSDLLSDDCDLMACAHSASSFNLTEQDVGMLLGSQDDHAALIDKASKTIAFT